MSWTPVADCREDLVFAVGFKLGHNVEQSSKARGQEEPTPTRIDPVLDARVTGRVGARLTLKYDRAAVWEDEPGSCQEQAALPEGDAAVVLADEPGERRTVGLVFVVLRAHRCV